MAVKSKQGANKGSSKIDTKLYLNLDINFDDNRKRLPNFGVSAAWWWATLAPWLKRVIEYLRYIPKGRAIAEAYDKEIFKSIEMSLNIFDAALEAVPEIPSIETAERLSPGHSRFQDFAAEGPALRALHSFLKEIDKTERWCGLYKTPTNDGNIFWLCDKHRALYKVT